MNEYATEGFGFKVLLSGAATGTTGWLASFDVVTVVGVVAVLGGFVLQFMGFLRKRRESRAAILATEVRQKQDLERHEMQMTILRQQLAELTSEVPK